MNEIKCPSCGKVFQIDEKDYESIVKQIRNHEFEDEIQRREKEFAKEKDSELEKLENKGVDIRLSIVSLEYHYIYPLRFPQTYPQVFHIKFGTLLSKL